MWPLSRSHNRQSSTSGERRCAHGSRRQSLAFRPALAAPEDRRLLSALQDPFLQLGTRSTVLTAVVNLFWAVGAASTVIAPVLGLMWAGLPAEAPAPEEPRGSGIVLRTEVTTIWMPRALRDLARHRANPPVDCSPEELQTYLGRNGWSPAWYALTYRGHQVNGAFGDITWIRRLSEAADYLDELQAVMATAAGWPPRDEGRDFSNARIEVIPETLQAVDPREAITRLMADPAPGEKSAPSGGPDSTRRTEWLCPGLRLGPEPDVSLDEDATSRTSPSGASS
jgi:hypothetical protein